MGPIDEQTLDRIDEVLASWRQGDCVVGEQWFVYRLDESTPLTPAAVDAANEQVDLAEAKGPGFMVTSQTCDIVRGCRERPFVEVCALHQVDANTLEDINRGRRPQFAFIPGLEHECLVADLDRVMTIEKAVLAGWDRTPGTVADADVRRLSQSLSRKRTRFAFPDDFVSLAARLRKRMVGKHDKQSPEGQTLRGLREIRVRAAPSWLADEVDLTLWFIRHEDDDTLLGTQAEECLARWLDLIPSGGRFQVDGVIQTLDDLTARDYVESDRLDLDHLSRK